MKTYSKALLILVFLNISSTTLSMGESEKDVANQAISLNDHILPPEMWKLILEKGYLNLDIINNAKDIHESVELIKKHIASFYKSISLVCRGFEVLNISKAKWPNFREEIKKYYREQLIQKFLTYENEEGVYPKGKKAWYLNPSLDKKIAQFISKGTFSILELLDRTKPGPSDCILYQVILLQNSNEVLESADTAKSNTIELLKILNLLIFYGANPNKDPLLLTQTIKCSYKNKYLIPVIQFLLDNQININAEYSSALFEAIDNAEYRNQCTSNEKIDIELIIMLLKNGADPNINNPILKEAINSHLHLTPRMYAKLVGFTRFEELVEKYYIPKKNECFK